MGATDRVALVNVSWDDPFCPLSLPLQFALMYGKQSAHFLALEPIARAIQLFPEDSFVLNGAATIYSSFVDTFPPRSTTSFRNGNNAAAQQIYDRLIDLRP